MEGPLADAELVLEALERTEDALPCGRLPAFASDYARVGHPETHNVLQSGSELGRQRHHPQLAAPGRTSTIPLVDSRSLRSVAWSKADPVGAEFAEVQVDGDVLAARGVAIGSTPFPYRLDYELETASAFVTSRLLVTARGNGWGRSLDLRRASSGVWEETRTEDGANSLPRRRAPTDLGALTDALDVDLGLSPLLNTPPVLRHGLARRAGSIDFVMAWVSVPDLSVHRSPQRYTFLRMIDGERSVVRFESLAEDDFKADVTYDAEGFVLDYPGIGTRI